jgi:MFS family permease
MNSPPSPFSIPNVRRFVWFRVLFHARFYYPVFTVLFLDFGLSLEQFALLNVAWAASIVVLEVPSGALADVMGRRNLLIVSAALMVLEMSILCFAPLGMPRLLFALFLLNRVISGAAEAASSGADEALAYDSLAREGDPLQWPLVLETQMRFQALAFVLSSTIGAAVYDPRLMQRAADLLQAPVTLDQDLTLRFPLILCLLMSFCALATAFRLREVRGEDAPVRRLCKEDLLRTLRDATRLTWKAGGWILATPIALVIILFNVTFDSMIRLFLTLNSQYYRVIELPEASFGLIGSALSVMGLVTPGWARRLTQRCTPRFNAALVTLLSLVGLVGCAFTVPYWGLIPVVPIFAAMFLLGFFVSHYLNAVTVSSQRATILSFRGLTMNFGFGVIGILYSLLLAVERPEVRAALPALSEGEIEDVLFVNALQWFPWYFLATVAITALFAAWSLRRSTFANSTPAT